MRTESVAVIGASTLAICAIGITAAYLMKRNHKINTEEVMYKVKDSKTLLDSITQVLKELSWEIIEKIVKYIKDYLLEVMFKTKMASQDQKINWSI